MESNVTLEQLARELEQVRRELRETKERYAHIVGGADASKMPSEQSQPLTPQSDGKRIEYPTDHPHIYTSPEMHRGEPTIRDSAISVRTIVERMRLGDAPERILEGYPHLTLAKIYDALSYYFDHKTEIDQHIRENEEAGWRAHSPVST